MVFVDISTLVCFGLTFLIVNVAPRMSKHLNVYLDILICSFQGTSNESDFAETVFVKCLHL